MRITEEQERILSSLTCERFSSNTDNLRLIGTFTNLKNESLVQTIQGSAFEEDEKGDIAYYLVKDSSERVLFYFSLKCGSLFDITEEAQTLKKIGKLYRYLVELLTEDSCTEEDKQTINSIIENIRARKGLIKRDLDIISKKKKSQILEELESKPASTLKHVGQSFAGIEIVHFCANDSFRDLWDKTVFRQKLGTVIFWKFIVPKICEAREIIGCQFVFLFAADFTPDEVLVNYYRSGMGFTDSAEHSAIIPLYDYGCKFMYQEIKDLEMRRNEFFDNFNPDENSR